MLGSVENWWKVVMAVANEALNFIGYLFYAIFTGVGMLINFVLSLFKKLAGIESMTLTATSTLGEDKGVTKQITVGGEGNWTDVTYAFITSDAVRTTFWTIFAMCIALLVVFTIFAIVKSEFSTDVKNAAKLPILERAVKSVINFLLIPVLSLASLYGANMLTKAVYYSFHSDSKYYITNVIFNAGATQANRASLDDGFANYLLATETVYFAEVEFSTPVSEMEEMLKTYFTIEEGQIVVRQNTIVQDSYTEEVTNAEGSIETVTRYYTKIQTEIVEEQALTTDGYSANTNTDRLHLLDYDKDKYEVTKDDYIAGKFTVTMKDGSKPTAINSTWYEWEIQTPVSTRYIDKTRGFQQVIPQVEYYTSYAPMSSRIKYVNLTVGEFNGANNVFYAGSWGYIGKSNNLVEITSDDVAEWWGAADSQGNNYPQKCKSILSEEDCTVIAKTVNNYVRTVKSETDPASANVQVSLWNVLKAEYNPADESNGLVFDDAKKPTPGDKNSIIDITSEQRKYLIGFINRIFVGDGNGSSGYCKYATWTVGQPDKVVMRTEAEVKNLKNSGNTTIAAVKVSSETLHVAKNTRKGWEKIVKDTAEWGVNYTPDYQQTFWRPSTYSGEAVMDMGLVGYFYMFNNMNLVMMLFGMVAIAWQYFKLILVFVKRALEMVLLFLMAPVVTAIAPLDKGNAENSWRSNWIKQLTMTAVPVFAINIFFTIVPLVSSLQMFKTTNPLALTYNAFVSIIFIYVGVSMINRASALLSNFLGTEDMIAQGKDLTGKATGVVGTAAKGAALVTGVALAGPAAVIKRGLGGVSGKRAANASRAASRKAALSDINNQIKEAKEAGDNDRVSQLESYRDNYDSFRANSADKQQFSKAEKDKALEELGIAQKAKESDEADLARLIAEQESLASVPMQMGRQKKWNAEEKKAWEDKKADVAARIAQKQSDIAEKNATIADAQRKAQYYANDERFYSGFSATDELARDARKNGITIDGKKYIGSKARREKSLVEDIKEVQKGYDKTFGKAMKETPVIKNTVGGAVNWAVDKMLLGSLGVVGQVADRKFSDIPKNLTDFVNGVDKTSGGILEKVLDPGKLGKVISTADENTKRETQKDEKTRAEIWEENAKREKEKMKAEEKAMADMKKKEETMQQLRDWETYKMGGFNVTGDKVNVNTDRNETVAKNYKSVIDKRAEEDYKNELYKTDKDFEKFKQMLKEMEDENKKKAQNVKIDPRDKGFGEQVIKAMKTVNAQNNRELKNINSGITSLSKNIEDLVKKMQ